jgi:hypothetical protein
MIKACPISIDRVDKYLLKSYAAIVVLFLFLFLIGYRIPFVFITADFIIRVFFGIKFSPTCFMIRYVFSLLHIRPRLINAGPKKFAAYVGLVFSLSILVSCSFEFFTIANVFASMFLVALLLELVLDYCLACQMQTWYLSMKSRFRI